MRFFNGGFESTFWIPSVLTLFVWRCLFENIRTELAGPGLR